jgi:acetolactate decarboxylase
MRWTWTAVLVGWLSCVLAVTLIFTAGSEHAPRSPLGEVQVAGTLRGVMHEGKTRAVARLADLLPDPDLWALGALGDLDGELTVIAGTAYLSRPVGPDEARTEVATESQAGAALLVSVRIEEWQTAQTARAVPFAEVGAEIERLATAAGLDPKQRIPFVLEGEFEDLAWHVVDGRRLPRGSASHEDHLAASVQRRAPRTKATLLGFWSANDQGVFTHMGERTHVHCVVPEPLSSGHVDHVVVPAGTTVKLPAARAGK